MVIFFCLFKIIEQTLNREGSLYLACNEKCAFFISEQPERYKLWSLSSCCRFAVLLYDMRVHDDNNQDIPRFLSYDV